MIFLSTPSARRATCHNGLTFLRKQHFYPRPPRGGRRGVQCSNSTLTRISIHALREEGDFSHNSSPPPYKEFLSTPSARRATIIYVVFRFESKNFYPRPPRGGRRRIGGEYLCSAIFLSTPSARRATTGAIFSEQLVKDFYPRPPRGGRLHQESTGAGQRAISIHALREEGDGT